MPRWYCRWLILAGVVANTALAAAEPEITIVRGYEGMARYAAAAAGADEATRARLYEQHVRDPYREQCSGTGDRFGISHDRLDTPIADIKGLAAAAAEVAKHPVDQRVTQGLRKALRLVPLKKVTACLFVFPPDSEMAGFVRERMSGLMGFNETPAVLWLEILPAGEWFQQLQYGAAHEFAHAASYIASVKNASLLEQMLAEGRADAFAASLYPDRVAPWTHALTPEQERTVWAAMQPHLDSTDDKIVPRYIFGMDGDEVPLWAGYTIGFRVAQRYLAQNSKESPATWLNLDAKTFLQKSGYGQ